MRANTRHSDEEERQRGSGGGENGGKGGRGQEAEKVERRVTVAEDEGNRTSFPFAKEEEARREPRETRIRQIEVCPSKSARMGR